MPHPYDIIPLKNGAQLLMTPCPGTKGESVENSLAQLKQAGTKTVLTLMLPEEQQHYGITNLQSTTETLGMTWINLPIPDDEKPDHRFEKPWENIKSSLVYKLSSGETVALHCKGGQGRTSLVSALIMLEMGMDWTDVKRQVRAVKPRGLVIEKHLAYIESSIAK